MNVRVEYIVHPSLYDKSSGHGIDVYRELSNAVRTDLRYHYSGPVCAGHWLDLCQSPEYAHDELILEVSANLGAMVGALRRAVGDSTPIDVVSLGPGDGEIDVRLLETVQRSLKLRRYVAIDVSFELLQTAVGRVTESSQLVRDFGVTALLGDFTKLDLPAEKSAARLVSLTGFTLGNHREAELLRRIEDIVHQRDLLFLDARLHPLPVVGLDHLTPDQRRLLVRGYNTEPANRFAFGPVEVVTTATASDVEFDTELNQEATSVRNAFNVIMYCKQLDTRARLNGHSITLRRLDLARGTTYRFEDLVEWFPTAGFDVVWKSRTDDTGFFLLQRS